MNNRREICCLRVEKVLDLSANTKDKEYGLSILEKVRLSMLFFYADTPQFRGSEVSVKPSALCSQSVSLPLMFLNANRRRT
jgi:hypothetical protein